MDRSSSPDALPLRAARPSDVAALRALIEISVRRLQAGDYSQEQIAGALGTVFGVDTQLIADQTYYVVESPDAGLVGCGGWSRRRTLFGSDQANVREDDLLDSEVDAARIRAFFIHPDWARKGIGGRILEACEAAARAAGFRRFEMGATLTGEKLYRMKGYVAVEHIEVPLANGARLPIVRMSKQAV
ncbi:MAG: GNAT family N-acetyltransferase [Acidobacteria bacterium]|nr:GNAT family N-acetyltransferase [Acidobacteriota bacterium]